MNTDAAHPVFSGWAKFWAVVRVAWAGLLIVGIGHGLVAEHAVLYGSIGGLIALVLLEARLIREGRSLRFDRLRRSPQ